MPVVAGPQEQAEQVVTVVAEEALLNGLIIRAHLVLTEIMALLVTVATVAVPDGMLAEQVVTLTAAVVAQALVTQELLGGTHHVVLGFLEMAEIVGVAQAVTSTTTTGILVSRAVHHIQERAEAAAEAVSINFLRAIKFLVPVVAEAVGAITHPPQTQEIRADPRAPQRILALR